MLFRGLYERRYLAGMLMGLGLAALSLLRSAGQSVDAWSILGIIVDTHYFAAIR